MQATRVALLVILAAVTLQFEGGVRGAQAGQGRGNLAPCSHSQIGVAAVDGTTGAGGFEEVLYRLSHLFGRPCILQGFPTVQVLDAHFAPRRTVVRHGGGHLGLPSGPVLPITMARGVPAFFYMAVVGLPGPVSGRCATYQYLSIRLPHDALPIVTYVVARSDLRNGSGGISVCADSVWVSPLLRHRA